MGVVPTAFSSLFLNFKLEVQHKVKKKVPKLIGTIREK